jgi:hypothetical protein
MASTQLKRTNGTPTNAKKGTVSFWLKRTDLGSTQRLMMNMVDGTTYSYIAINSSHYLQHYASSNSTQYCHFRTNALYRDTTAWYHFVFSIDTTQSDADNRVRIYVNGEEVTSWLENARPTQNTNHPLLVASASNYHTIGASEANTLHFDGLMSHFHFIDGTAYAPTEFGETDSTTGEWKIKINPSVTYGNNGYFMFKDDASLSDQSGNGNNFTASGTLTQTEDCPSNNFPTFGNGYILPNGSTNNFSKGGLTASNSSAIWQSEICPFGFNAGKYYWEMKLVHNGGDPRGAFGIINSDTYNINSGGNNVLIGGQTGFYGYQSGGSGNGKSRINGANSLTNLTNFDATDGTIIGFAIDCDNKRMYLHVNGTYEHSGNPSAGTGFENCSTGWTTGDTFLPCFTTHNLTLHYNFGNGYFGATAISSEGTNASGIGKFEYDVPTGFTALCTKGLNE